MCKNLLNAFMAAIFLLVSALAVHAQEKEVYIPTEVLAQDFENPQSQWCRQRMKLTKHFTILWEKGFGDNPATAPDLNGMSMKCDLDAFGKIADEIFEMYRYRMQFVNDSSNCDRYRMLIFLKYNDDVTALGGSKDNTIGAVWQISPRYIRHGANMLAHEMGHCFQQQTGCDKSTKEFFGQRHGFCEMCSQWGLWNYSPNWVVDEEYHLNNYIKKTHKPFFDRSLCGMAPYVLQYWSERHGITFIGKLYREGRKGEDCITVYKRLTGMNQSEFCDELFEAFRHTVNLDFALNWQGNRELGLKFGTDYDKESDYWKVPVEICPESYGYNAINIDIPSFGQTVKVHFYGIVPNSPYKRNRPFNAGWRYGFVMADEHGHSYYGEKSSEITGDITFTTPDSVKAKKLWLVVMGAPSAHWDIPDGEIATDSIDAQWPYWIRVTYSNKEEEVIEPLIIEPYHGNRDNESFPEPDEMPSFKGGDITTELIDASTGKKIKQVHTFPGGKQGLMQYLTSMIRYPGDAIMGNIEGRVVVSFVVESTGEITDVKVARSAHPSLDKEAVRLVESMPNWNPGMLNGKPVRTKFALPITFRL